MPAYTALAEDLAQASVSEQAYKSTMGLMEQILNKTNFLQEGFTKTSRNQWKSTIENLAAYFKKTRPLLISRANVSLFNDSIKALQSSTKELFEVSDYFVTQGQGALPSALASELNKLAKYMPNINALLDQLKTTKSTDLQGTIKLKALFYNVLDAWKQLYVKAHGIMHSRIAGKETTTRKARLEAELKSTTPPVFFLRQISWVKSRLGEKPGEQGSDIHEAAKGLDAITNELIKGFNNDLKRNNYLQMLKAFLTIKELYAKLPANFKQKTTEQNITKYINLIMGKLSN